MKTATGESAWIFGMIDTIHTNEVVMTVIEDRREVQGDAKKMINEI